MIPPAPLKLLLVEDNLVNQLVATRILEAAGHSVVLAGNGLEALRALERGAFDIILMDVQMPEMDGFEAAKAIREKERGTSCQIPIIAMTAHAMSEDRERCIASGKDAYLSKPVRRQEVLSIVANYAPQAVNPSGAQPEPTLQ